MKVRKHELIRSSLWSVRIYLMPLPELDHPWLWRYPWGVFGSTTRVTRVSSDNANIAAEHQEPAEVLPQLGDTSTPQIMGSKSVTTVATSSVLVAASGVLCDCSLFSLEITVSTKLLTSDGARTETSVSLKTRSLWSDNNTRRSGWKAGVLVLRMSVRPPRVTRVILPNTPICCLKGDLASFQWPKYELTKQYCHLVDTARTTVQIACTAME